MTPRRARAAAAALVAATSIAWLDPHHAVRQANELYDQGKYDDAAAAYNAGLVDKPDSPELHFNLGDATYKQGKYADAVSAFQKVETADDPARAARVAYNIGNAQFLARLARVGVLRELLRQAERPYAQRRGVAERGDHLISQRGAEVVQLLIAGGIAERQDGEADVARDALG